MNTVRKSIRKAASGPKSYLVSVVPIIRSAGFEPLSYFSLTSPKIGQLVRVEIRKKKVISVVVGVTSAHKAKIDIRKSSFSLKKISKNDFLSAELGEPLLKAVEITSRFFASSLGSVLSVLLPSIILKNISSLAPIKKSKGPKIEGSYIKEPLVIQLDREERISQYRSIIRQNFARNSSVLLIVPGPFEAEKIFDSLSKGIESYTFLLSTDDKKSEAKKWLSAKELKHPVLVISTPTGITFDRADLNTIILERENSRAYRTFTKPYINFKNFLINYARLTGKDCYLGDSVLSLETLWLEREGGYGEFTPVKWRLTSAETRVVDMKPPKEDEKERSFEVISPDLEKLIKDSLAEKERILIFGVRKGLSPSTVCGDCGEILACPECKAPMVLHKKGGLIYVCHRCGHKKDSETVCNNCQSWKLNPLGIGTELIAQEVQKKFPLSTVHILDKDYGKTPARARRIVKEFEEKGGILVSTEQIFYYLDKVSSVGIVSVDPFFSLPDFNAEEKVFYLISRLRELAERKVLIQTRNIGKETIVWSAQGNILDFFKREIEDRRKYLYPPFGIFIKIESTEARKIAWRFSKWEPEVLKDSIIIRLPRQSWPNRELLAEIALLPPNFSIKVDPESLI